MTPQQEQITSLSARAASVVLRHQPWHDRDELTNEAVVAILQAADRYDPSRGIPFGAFAWTVAIRRLQRYVKQLGKQVPVGSPLDEETVGLWPTVDPRRAHTLTLHERRGLVEEAERHFGAETTRELLDWADAKLPTERVPTDVKTRLNTLKASAVVKDLR